MWKSGQELVFCAARSSVFGFTLSQHEFSFREQWLVRFAAI
jgi:hypothetical protein